jgi:hypothetical protein
VSVSADSLLAARWPDAFAGPLLSVWGVAKSFAGTMALNAVDIEVPQARCMRCSEKTAAASRR